MESTARYLSKKVPLLANPGEKRDDTYYTKENTIVNQAETTYFHGRIQQSVPSTLFNSTSQISIPIGTLLMYNYLVLELPDLVPNQTLERGWGIAALRQLGYLAGSSATPIVTINKQTILHVLLSECETAEKASELFRLAGESLTAPTGGSIFAYVPLPFPWSVFTGIDIKKPIDTNLLVTPVILQIDFDSNSAIYGGNGVRPSAFLSARLINVTGEFTNRDRFSLRDTMIRVPSDIYTYPMLYHQSYNSQSFLGSTNVNAPVNLQIQSFQDGDLVGMIFSVVAIEDLAPVNNSTPNTFNYDNIRNFNLTLNGQTVYFSPGELYKLMGTEGIPGASYFFNNFTQPGNISPFAVQPINSYPLFANFSRNRPSTFSHYWQNVWRIGNNTMELSFNTSQDADVRYIMFVTMIYNSILEVSNGQTRIYT